MTTHAYGAHAADLPLEGHEAVGRVSAAGAEASGFKVGDLGGVGCIVDSCKQAVAPLLCAGITTWSPLRHWKVGPGSRVGVVGIGGLGHMGIKLAHAMGAHVVAFTTSESKREAAKALGADEVVVSRNGDEMKAHTASLDFILNTVAAPHDLDAFMALLKRDGTMTLVGVPATPHPSPQVFHLVGKRRALAGSMIGGIPETQEMLDFCADQVNEAYERMLASDVKYRFVMENSTLGDVA